ncbi:MAG: threonine aldolase family protein [Magnetospiraceae bacterium]
MNFESDNVSGAAPEILEALAAANAGAVSAYGADDLTRRAERMISDVFETEAAVFLVATGTASNSLALAAMTPPYGSIFCHRDSHINQDECGAPELQTGGAKLVTVAGAAAKIDPVEFRQAAYFPDHGVHAVERNALSLTQATECGTLYSVSEIRALSEIAVERGMAVHMDGARFSNAMASLNASPAEMTWKAGVDILSFGASKNGTLAAEAIVVFNPALAQTIGRRRKRAGHLFSKMRFLAAQWVAFLTDDLWLRNARHANAMARQMEAGLRTVQGVRIAHPVEANQLFVSLPEATIQALEAVGFTFYRWPDEDPGMIRLVTGFDTDPAHVDFFIETARGISENT